MHISSNPIVQKEADRIRTDWFKDHHIIQAVTPGVVIWGKPNTSIYRIHYLIYGSCLVVLGDVGEAIYQWNTPPDGKLTVEWLAGLDIGYFAEKCRASSETTGIAGGGGRTGESWWSRLAEQRLSEIAGLVTAGHEDSSLKLHLSNHGMTLDDLRRFSLDYNDWMEFLRYDGDKVFGDSAWHGYIGIGFYPSPRTMSHLIGLKMIHRVHQT